MWPDVVRERSEKITTPTVVAFETGIISAEGAKHRDAIRVNIRDDIGSSDELRQCALLELIQRAVGCFGELFERRRKSGGVNPGLVAKQPDKLEAGHLPQLGRRRAVAVPGIA